MATASSPSVRVEVRASVEQAETVAFDIIDMMKTRRGMRLDDKIALRDRSGLRDYVLLFRGMQDRNPAILEAGQTRLGVSWEGSTVSERTKDEAWRNYCRKCGRGPFDRRAMGAHRCEGTP